MAQNKTKAKYFCENCGSEVAAKAKFCTKCGTPVQASIQKPASAPEKPHAQQPTGSAANAPVQRSTGCPGCHYAMTHEEIYGSSDDEEETLDGRKHKLSFLSKLKIKNAFKQHEKNVKKQYAGDGTPAWLFIACVVVLIGLIVLTFYRCQ